MTLKRGDDWILRGVLTDAAGDPVDLTGCELLMHVRTKVTAPEPELTASTALGSIEVDAPATNGAFSVLFHDTDTQSVAPRTYVTDLQFTWADGKVSSSETWAIEVVADVTRE
jgi:hypothetical protein